MKINKINLDTNDAISLPTVKRKTKPLIVIQAPYATRSGYGDHSRDLIKSLISSDKYDVKLISTRWGGTPMNALDYESEEWCEKFVQYSMFDRQEIEHLVRNKLIDIYIQVTVPNEFQPLGKYNIGITAGIETTMCSGQWLLGMNRMDMNIVPSEHAKNVFKNTTYDMQDQNGGISKLSLNKPIEVLFEGNDCSTYFPIKYKEYIKDKDIQSEEIVKQLDTLGDFNFLFVGHWLQGDFGQDRKDISGLIYTFLHTFYTENKNVKMPSLILKTSRNGFSFGDRLAIVKYVDNIKSRVLSELSNEGTKDDFIEKDIQLPEIHLLHGQLTEKEMNLLYNHPSVKAMVSFTKGEGYGRPLQEFAATGKPAIASGWSGQVDFLNPAYNVLLEGELKQVHPSAVWKEVIEEQSQWFSVDYRKAKDVLTDVYKKYNSYKIDGLKNATYIRNYFSLDVMKDKFIDIISGINEEKSLPDIIKMPIKDALTESENE